MIEQRKTIFRGKSILVDVDVADMLEDNDRKAQKRRAAVERILLAQKCAAAGYDPKTMPKMSPETAIRLHFGRLRAELGPAEMLKRYPCRACEVMHSDKYKAECRDKKQVPCFFEKRFQGCPQLKPLPVVA